MRILNHLAFGIALLALPVRADSPRADPPPAPREDTWLLTFPGPGTVPDFDLVSLQLLQTRRPSLPALADLAAKPGSLPALGILTVVVTGPAEDLVAYLEAHPGGPATLYEWSTGSSLAMADCRLIHPVAPAQGRPLRRVLKLTYAALTITQEDP